jgi:Cytochrome P450
VAGASTTAMGLTYTLYFLISDEKAWKRISEEIRSKFQSVEEITGQSIAPLVYLNAVINEGTSSLLPVLTHSPSTLSAGGSYPSTCHSA